MQRGRFITLEGSEGAGKSSNLQVICDLLDREGVDYYVTREPGGTALAESIRELMLGDWEEPVGDLTELLLVFAARNQHLQTEIKPRLSSGQWVICDRFTDATYAYQGSGRGLPRNWIETLEHWVQDALRPDLTLYLDLDPAVGRARIADRAHDRLEREQLAFFERVRAGYLERAASEAYIQVIDADQSIEQVRKTITQVLEAFIADGAQG